MQRARGAVKEELKRQRIRLADVEAREITERARDYLEAHPSLVADLICKDFDCCKSHERNGAWKMIVGYVPALAQMAKALRRARARTIVEARFIEAQRSYHITIISDN
jgi:hypothetical protein